MATAQVYEPSIYNGLPRLLEAYDIFSMRDPLEIIRKEISSLFLKHNVYKELSISLVHRHFEMQPDEKLVEFGSVSTPWPNLGERSSLLISGEVVPRSWMFFEGRMMPYEFGYNESTKEAVYKDLPDTPDFYRELNNLLQSYHLTDLLGLQLNTDATQDDFIKFEKTFDRANIIFTTARDPALASKEAISAQWVYRPLGDAVVPVKKLVIPS